MNSRVYLGQNYLGYTFGVGTGGIVFGADGIYDIDASGKISSTRHNFSSMYSDISTLKSSNSTLTSKTTSLETKLAKTFVCQWMDGTKSGDTRVSRYEISKPGLWIISSASANIKIVRIQDGTTTEEDVYSNANGSNAIVLFVPENKTTMTAQPAFIIYGKSSLTSVSTGFVWWWNNEKTGARYKHYVKTTNNATTLEVWSLTN